MHPILQKLWKDMWGPGITLADVMLVIEYTLLKQGRSELEIAALAGRFAGNIFKSRERLTDLFAGEKD